MFKPAGSLVILVLAIFGLEQIQAKPGLSDLFRSNKCTDTPAEFCAVVFDDDKCQKGDWAPLGIKDGESRSFSVLQANPLKGLDNLFNYKNDIESFTVKKGCTLTVYKDSDYSGGEHAFAAPADADLIVKELEDGPYDEFSKFCPNFFIMLIVSYLLLFRRNNYARSRDRVKCTGLHRLAQACTGWQTRAQTCKNFSFLDWLGCSEYAKQVLAWLDHKQKFFSYIQIGHLRV